MPHQLAVVDLGSNSFHLAVFELLGGTRFRQVHRVKSKVQLGRSVFRDGVLSDEVFARGLEALCSMRKVLAESPLEARIAVATSALREAANGAAFLAAATPLIGAPIRLIAGDEEARLVGLGATHERNDEPTIVFDLGGGSLEVVAMEGDRCAFAASLALGTLRTRPEWAGPLPSQAELAALREHVERVLTSVLADLRGHREKSITLSCGAARAMRRLSSELGSKGAVVTRERIRALRAWLAVDTGATRMLGMDERDRLLVAVEVFDRVLTLLGKDRARIAEGGIRHGLAVDYLRRRPLDCQGAPLAAAL